MDDYYDLGPRPETRQTMRIMNRLKELMDVAKQRNESSDISHFKSRKQELFLKWWNGRIPEEKRVLVRKWLRKGGKKSIDRLSLIDWKFTPQDFLWAIIGPSESVRFILATGDIPKDALRFSHEFNEGVEELFQEEELEKIKILSEFGYFSKYPKQVVQLAVYNNALDVADWAVSAGYPVIPRISNDNDHSTFNPETVKWVLDHGGIITPDNIEAARIEDTLDQYLQIPEYQLAQISMKRPARTRPRPGRPIRRRH